MMYQHRVGIGLDGHGIQTLVILDEHFFESRATLP
jgi:hypothetical protein